jgi:hypothetical protein
METVTRIAGEQRGLYSNQLAAFDYSERQSAFAARIMNCISRAFDAIGAGSQTQELVYWNLHITKNIKRNEIVDKPSEFIEGLQTIYGEAGVVVFQSMITREIRREFRLTSALDQERTKGKNLADLLQFLALEFQRNPYEIQGL